MRSRSASKAELVDLDADGVIDAAREVATMVVDGDGWADMIETTATRTMAYDLDGDGWADIIETTTVTGVDPSRDGTIDDDEIWVEVSAAIREDLLDGAGQAESLGSDVRRRPTAFVVAVGVLATAAVWWGRRRS